MKIVFIVWISFIAVLGCSEQQSESKRTIQQQYSQIQLDLPEEIMQFIEKTAPELLDKLKSLASLLQDADEKINKLNHLKSDFPQHSEIIKPRIDKWLQARKKLHQTQKQIDHQIEKAFVIYEVNQGVHEFEETAKTLMQKADEAFKIAESLTKIEAELQQPTSQ